MLTMAENTERAQQAQHEGYTTGEAQRILGLKHTAFYREVEEAGIARYPRTKRTYYYDMVQIDELAQRLATESRRVGRPSRDHTHGKKSEETASVEKAEIRPLAQEDIGAVYHLQHEQLGYENTAQPSSMRKWIKDNLPIYWVAHDPRNPRDIWAVLGVIPMDEELIIRFLREEFALEEVAISAVLPYGPGQSHACYLSAAAQPTHRDSLVQLMEYLLSYLCDQYPNMSIRILYASAPKGMEETPLRYMLKTLFFSRRRDISVSKSIWELPLDDLDEYNPAPAIQWYQKCIKEKKSMLVLDKVQIEEVLKKSEAKPATSPFSAPLQLRRAETKEDVAAMVQIGAEIFLPPGVQPSIPNEHQVEVWYSWLMKNPEIFHVLAVNDEIIGYISMIPLPQNIIDNVMRGAHPTTITPDDVLLFEPEQPLNVYVHIWGTTPRLAPKQKRYAGAQMVRELRNIFMDFAQRGVDIREIYTRSNKEDGIAISEHIGFEDLEVPGVTDAPNPADRKHVFRIDTTRSTNPFMIQYREALEDQQRAKELSAHKTE